ncbi:MAG: 4Fe-4S dicluster domain-containing protein [Clostridiales bacterium]|nr:4Fe-4S dicluster domain-containing protein [Clostridiales bacterium]
MAYLGEKNPKLGFGFMRLPMSGKDIDIEQTKQMVDLFMKKGFTYFDTAFGYANGKSEEALKTSLIDRYPRESFQIATKLPAWTAKNEKEAKDMFHISMERLGTKYIDFYLLHNVGQNRKKSFDDFGIWDYVRELKAEGLVKHIGFSFHDRADVLEAILNEHPDMEFVQLQINYADWENGSVESRKCYETALRHNKPIVVMEPVKGGALSNPAESVRRIFESANPTASVASWAIRFAASLENIITVLSGMSNVAQMEDNLSYMEQFKPLDAAELDVINKAREALDAIPSIPCTNCRYCVKDCPKNIAIPDFFTAMNRKMVFNDLNGAKGEYRLAMMFGSENPAECITCGKCEEVCPQQIEIIDKLKDTVKLLG